MKATPTASAEVKKAWNFTSSPPVRLHGVVIGNKSNFTGVHNPYCVTLCKTELVIQFSYYYAHIK
jgi:hypothetical protein